MHFFRTGYTRLSNHNNTKANVMANCKMVTSVHFVLLIAWLCIEELTRVATGLLVSQYVEAELHLTTCDEHLLVSQYVEA
jgi:hypothetical protein